MSTNERDAKIAEAAEEHKRLSLGFDQARYSFDRGASWAFAQSDARVERPEDQLSKIKGECAVAIMESVELKARVKALRGALEELYTAKNISADNPFWRIARAALESDELAEGGGK